MSVNTFFSIMLFLPVTSALAIEARVPQKYLDSELRFPATQASRFSQALVQNKKFVNVKKEEWKACKRTRISSQLFAQAQDRLESFLESPVTFDTLEKMEASQLQKAELEQVPWSGDYWPYARGILGARFLDFHFSSQFGWLGKYEYVRKNPSSILIEKKGQEAVDTLSPAEKYDLLTGNESEAFTASQWEQGKEYYDSTGEVEGWMGICHGWAPAAMMEPRPAKSVDVQSYDGKWNLHFNPSEIKGLLSYSWATNPFPVVTLGKRCNDKDPSKDENGRITDPGCFDLNPSTWHLAIVHKLGLEKRSFIMDATYDYEVWNQPVVGYSYQYFNPKTGKKTSELKQAVVSRSEFNKDPYSKYRSPKTSSIVGIEMSVSYVVENGSSGAETDSAEQDVVLWVEYVYDLELDEKGKIIGGEWHETYHPDFIWTPKKGVKPMSYLDRALSSQDWVAGEVIPESWMRAAHIGAPRGLILNVITEGIVEKASRVD